MTVRAWSWFCACAALASLGQNIDIGQGGVRMTEGNTVLAPPPISVGEALDMAELPLRESPPQFYLNYGTSGRYGPYALADGTLVGNPQSPFTLNLFDYGSHFTLHARSGTNTVSYGPFAATNGAQVVVGGSVMTVVRFPLKLLVSLYHPGKLNQAPLIGIAPRDNALLRELYGLRAKYVNLANRVDYDTADVELEGVPRVYSRATGNTFSPIVKKSARDRQNTVKGAELSAVRFLETLMGQAFRIRSQAITDGSTYHFGMPPGDYVLCALQKIKDPLAQGVAGSSTAVWWTAFHFDGEHPLTLALTAENAITWREIFALDRKTP